MFLKEVESLLLGRRCRPEGSGFLDCLGPVYLSAALAAVIFLKEYFTFAVITEEPLLFLEFFGQRDTLSPLNSEFVLFSVE